MIRFRVKLGDCLEVMRDIPDSSFHSVVTDPPAGISFMGKNWDNDRGGRNAWIVWMTEVAVECLRAVKPGGYALVWALPRTSHWTATAWEDAGFELREKIFHLFGSGFPKSRDIGKDIQKRESGGIKNLEIIGTKKGIKTENGSQGFSYREEYVPGISPGGKQISGDIPVYKIDNEWAGWGTALKPAVEEWLCFRKPLSEKTIAENVLRWGVGGLNIEGCRVEITDNANLARNNKPGDNGWKNSSGGPNNAALNGTTGRWPANLILDEEAGEMLDQQSGISKSTGGQSSKPKGYGDFGGGSREIWKQDPGFGDVEGASRFFYCSKASKKDREEGNTHSTVKNSNLMRYLCKLITPPNGIVFDPFMGSGSTGKAALLEGFRFYGIDKEQEYVEIARKRLENAEANS